MPRNFQNEIRQVKDGIAMATARLHRLVDEWSAQTERDRLEWLRNLRHAEHRAEHAERQTGVCESALIAL